MLAVLAKDLSPGPSICVGQLTITSNCRSRGLMGFLLISKALMCTHTDTQIQINF